MDELTFQDEVERQPIDIPRAALRFAKEIAYPNLDVGLYLSLLDGLADWARPAIEPHDSLDLQAQTLAHFLFHQLGFKGNSSEYNDPRNSFLNEVLNRRLGIPISLSVIFIALAERLDLPARGVGMPGHFIVSLPGPEGEIFVDPFHAGEVLSRADCEALVRSTTGYTGPFHPEWLEPVLPEVILTRMLNNLKTVYMQAEEWMAALKVVEHIRLLQPGIPELLRDLGVIHHRTGSLRMAIRYYEQYLQDRPDAPDTDSVLGYLRSAAQKLAERN